MAINIVFPGQSERDKAKLAKSLTSEAVLLEITGLRKSAKDLVESAKRNALKDEKELNLTLQSLAKDFSRLSASQRASAGSSGFDVNSTSFLSVYAEAANQFDVEVSRRRDINTENQRLLIRESLVRAEAINTEADRLLITKEIEEL